ncbi:hypothetical protein ANOM_010750 [Aspergillus nomiae NRRL 13137]|uniref:Cyclohexanone monooxygenase n=1 Tax=Aspergillus nomiae NRRL (strain ATCC 15546 / NRRL 13137 / CBS 260.88 / M93) TaxID=1509407 RepID=A0A0L1IQN9_ASPN3|nr:uncharacterized protein ANOM_010750 [Aspergillus nomiae NRRL 13137]KNG81812.1 hypothetical protein ANOM_010750 [Aspergillus nomiae NRRL 13137]
MTVDTNIYDAVIVGAGFAGIYQLHRFVNMGMSVKLIDKAGGLGGTWYWNRYPGAMSDTNSVVYRYSWDPEDLREYKWPRHYVRQPEVLAYLEHVVERYDLEKYMQFNTELVGMEYDEVRKLWKIETPNGPLTARYVVTALGLLNRQNWPDIPHMKDYQGEIHHTSNFPKEYDFTNKRVGVIGCGSTGVQVITALGPQVKHLTCFQRRPQYSVPAGDAPVTEEYRDYLKENYDQIWDQVRGSFVAMGFEESTVSALEVSDEERERIYQAAWDKGNGLRFMFWTFKDLTTSEAANITACDFIRRKIDQIVKDPKKARKLKPTELYARRPLCDSGYYETFNRANVDIVDVKATPFVKFTPTGIQTADGVNHELDAVICATGFDAVDGSYSRLGIRGRGGKTLQAHWETEPRTFMGCAMADFPNLFMVNGPRTVFANIPPSIESHVEFITDLVAHAEAQRNGARQSVEVEVTKEAEDRWAKLCIQASEGSLFTKTDSWIFGANVKGKKKAVLFYWGGLGTFRKILRDEREAGYKSFILI